MREDNNHAATGTDLRMTEVMRDYHASLPIPDGEAAWEFMSARLTGHAGRNRSRSWLHRLKLAGVAAALMLMLQLVFGELNPVEAITKFFLETKRSSTATSVNFGNYDMSNPTGMLTDPPPPEDFYARVAEPGEVVPQQLYEPENDRPLPSPTPSNHLEFSTIEEAQPLVAFPIQEPADLPANMALANVTMLRENEEKTSFITLKYEGEDGKAFYLDEGLVGDNYSASTSVTDPEAVVKEIKIGSARGVILISGRYVHMQWLTDTMSYRLHGILTEKEAMKIARSIKALSKN